MRDTFFVTKEDDDTKSNSKKYIFNLIHNEINLMQSSFLEEILYYLYHPRYTFYYCKRKIGLKIRDLKDRFMSYVSSRDSNSTINSTIK